MFGYRIPQPDEALLISGRRARDGGETPSGSSPATVSSWSPSCVAPAR